MEILTRAEVMERVNVERAYALQKDVFRAFSLGTVVQAPVGHLDSLVTTGRKGSQREMQAIQEYGKV